MQHHQQRLFLLPRQRADQIAQLPPRIHVQIGGGLVHQKDAGILGQQHGQERPLPLAAGQLPQGAVGKVLHPSRAQGLGHHAPVFRAEPARRVHVGVAAQRRQCAHRQGGLGQDLRQDADLARALPGWGQRKAHAVQANLPGVALKSVHAADQRALAAAVAAQQHRNAVGTQRKADFMEDGFPPMVDAHAVKFKHPDVPSPAAAV